MISQIYFILGQVRLIDCFLCTNKEHIEGERKGIFDTQYPLDSKITYNWTENHDDDLKKTIADRIITINDRVSYHFEAQIGEDEEMQFRVFDYGYHHALKTRNGREVLIIK